MATTTVATEVTRQALRLIETDYAVHRTGEEHSSTNDQTNRVLPTRVLDSTASTTVTQPSTSDGLIDPSTAPHPRVQGVISPPWWPSNRFRGVPEYAPINYGLDRSERPVGENAVIGFALTTTFSGCHILTVSASLVHCFGLARHRRTKGETKQS